MMRLVCWLRGHRWNEIAINARKHFNLGHLHPMAGVKAECIRCGAVWDDLWSPFFDEDVVVLIPQDLPRARLRR
jgi:hypothetical protein